MIHLVYSDGEVICKCVKQSGDISQAYAKTRCIREIDDLCLDCKRVWLEDEIESVYGEDVIILHEGNSGDIDTDQYGSKWIPFEVDYLALETSGICSICGAELSSGYTCLDGGEEVCNEHVIWLDDYARGLE